MTIITASAHGQTVTLFNGNCGRFAYFRASIIEALGLKVRMEYVNGVSKFFVEGETRVNMSVTEVKECAKTLMFHNDTTGFWTPRQCGRVLRWIRLAGPVENIRPWVAPIGVDFCELIENFKKGLQFCVDHQVKAKFNS